MFSAFYGTKRIIRSWCVGEQELQSQLTYYNAYYNTGIKLVECKIVDEGKTYRTTIIILLVVMLSSLLSLYYHNVSKN